MRRSQGTGAGRTVKAAVVIAIAAAALVGCGDDDEADKPAPTSTAVPSETPSASSSGGAAADGATDLLAAGKAALREVDGSTVISIESESGGAGWEVQLVTADGTEHELVVSSDGSTVVSGPREKNEDAADKTKHQDRVKAAKLDYEAAVTKLLEEIPGGRITELNLDSEQGRTIWEADVVDTSNDKHEVDLDAASGEILSNDVSD